MISLDELRDMVSELSEAHEDSTAWIWALTRINAPPDPPKVLDPGSKETE